MGNMILNKNMVMPQTEITDKTVLLRALCAKAEQNGFVSAAFANALKKREAEFPTGLETPIPIALPHVGVECYKSFMGVATLEKPMLFESMSGGDPVAVRIVFLFGIVDPAEQVVILRKFSRLFQDRDFLERLSGAGTPEAALAPLRETLGDLLSIE